jgi:hypothetical protein
MQYGSNVEVPNPKILINGFYKDFGYGVCCTNYEKQAKRWALTKKGVSVVNLYFYEINKDLKVLSFEKMTEEWLDFVASCRHGIEHNYNIVEGSMADDQHWNYVKGFLSGR